MSPTKMAPGSALDADNKNAKEELGARRKGPNGEVYIYCQNVDRDAGSGDAAELAELTFNSDGSISTLKASTQTSGGGSAYDGKTFGAANASITKDNYGWFQIKGPFENLSNSNAAVSDGDYVKPSSSNDGEWVSASAGDDETGGFATEAGSSSDFNAVLGVNPF